MNYDVLKCFPRWNDEVSCTDLLINIFLLSSGWNGVESTMMTTVLN